MANGDTPTQGTKDFAQAAPSGTEAGAPQITPDQMQQLMRMAQVASTPHREATMPEVRPQAKHLSLGQDIGTSLLGSFVPMLGGAIQRHLKQQKEAQITEAYQDFKAYHDAMEEAWIMSGGDQQKADQMFQESRGYKNLFDPNNPASKKKLKNYSKIFQFDPLNPEKTKANTAYQGMQKFLTEYPKSKAMKSLFQQMQGGMGGAMAGAAGGPAGMGAGMAGGMAQPGQQPQQQPQPQPQQQAQQQPQPQGAPGGMPTHMAQANPQILEQMLRLAQQRGEFQMTYERLRQEHTDRLEQQKAALDERQYMREQSHLDRLQMLQMRQQQFGENEQIRKEIAEENTRHHKELEKEAEDRRTLAKDLGETRNQIMRDRLNAAGGKVKADTQAGMRVLHVSLFGGAGQKGLVDVIDVLDKPGARVRLSTLGNDFIHPQEGSPGILGGLKRMMEAAALKPEEREYIRQINRAVSAINGLRGITGLPRSTQALMDRYIMELPNAMLDADSSEALDKIMLIQREINAAMEDAVQKMSQPGYKPEADSEEEPQGRKISK